MDGRHGLIADSLAYDWETVRAQSGINGGSATFPGPRLQPPVGPLSEGRDWMIVETIDREQIFFASETRTIRLLQVLSLDARYGRGRVVRRPYGPWLNRDQMPWRSTAGIIDMLTRATVTPVHATACSTSSTAIATEYPPGAGGFAVPLDNYKAWMCEGRPVPQFVPDIAWCSARAQLDVPLVPTVPGFGALLTPVPDFAVRLMVDIPHDYHGGGPEMCVCWVDAVGQRQWPASAATFGQGPVVTDSPSPFTVPRWATAMHLYLSTAAAAPTFPINITWELLV